MRSTVGLVRLLVLLRLSALSRAEQIVLDTPRTPLGIPSSVVQGLPSIVAWTSNPAGDAVLVQTDAITENATKHELHILAVDAQFSVPTTLDGSRHPDAMYCFLDNNRFAILQPGGQSWALSIRNLTYETGPGAVPPQASNVLFEREVQLSGRPIAFVHAPGVAALIALTNGEDGAYIHRWSYKSLWEPGHSSIAELSGHIVEAAAVGTDSLLLTTHPLSRPINETGSQLSIYNLSCSSPTLQLVNHVQEGRVSSAAFGPNDEVVWLQQEENGNARSRRHVWLARDGVTERLRLKWDLSPFSCMFWQDGKAIALLAQHGQSQSLFQLWKPTDDSLVLPVRIPSEATIHSAVHVGVTPLNHSHFIALQSSLSSGHEMWVVSSNPWDDPEAGFENIRLTNFTREIDEWSLTSGHTFQYDNGQGTPLEGRVFTPRGNGPFRTILYAHGDEEGGAWHDWWMRYWNPNTFVHDGWAVLTINPTGAEGYGDELTRARRFQWGGQAVDDLRLGLAYAADHFSLDTSFMVGLGYGAYGGWVTHWINGHQAEWNATFRGLVAHGGIMSPLWWAYESVSPYKAMWEFGSLDQAENSSSPYHTWDASSFAGSWSVPMLLITDGSDDEDVGTAGQSMAAYRILQSMGVYSKFVLSINMAVWQSEIEAFLDKVHV